jgi:hypothetical protein
MARTFMLTSKPLQAGTATEIRRCGDDDGLKEYGLRVELRISCLRPIQVGPGGTSKVTKQVSQNTVWIMDASSDEPG